MCKCPSYSVGFSIPICIFLLFVRRYRCSSLPLPPPPPPFYPQVIGLHGAGLANAVFSRSVVILVELRTLYGYDTDLFARVADSRNGTYVHIDARSYSKIGRVHLVDDALVDRVVRGIFAAQDYQKSPDSRLSFRISGDYEDYVIGPAPMTGDLGHLLGPPAHRIEETCRQLPYARYRDEVLEGMEMQYCSLCK